MAASSGDTLLDTDILPVRCPRCGEAQNTLDGALDPRAPGAEIGCMVCGHTFDAAEYGRLLDERRREFSDLAVRPR